MDGWIAVGAFGAFIVVILALNAIEFGRPD
jgi:hypothetical protein